MMKFIIFPKINGPSLIKTQSENKNSQWVPASKTCQKSARKKNKKQSEKRQKHWNSVGKQSINEHETKQRNEKRHIHASVGVHARKFLFPSCP